MTLAELFTIHMNLHVMEFLLILMKQISWKSQNPRNPQNLRPSKKEHPTVAKYVVIKGYYFKIS